MCFPAIESSSECHCSILLRRRAGGGGLVVHRKGGGDSGPGEVPSSGVHGVNEHGEMCLVLGEELDLVRDGLFAGQLLLDCGFEALEEGRMVGFPIRDVIRQGLLGCKAYLDKCR